MGRALLGNLDHAAPDLTPEAALRLEFRSELNEGEELATVYTLAGVLTYIIYFTFRMGCPRILKLCEQP